MLAEMYVVHMIMLTQLLPPFHGDLYEKTCWDNFINIIF